MVAPTAVQNRLTTERLQKGSLLGGKEEEQVQRIPCTWEKPGRCQVLSDIVHNPVLKDEVTRRISQNLQDMPLRCRQSHGSPWLPRIVLLAQSRSD